MKEWFDRVLGVSDQDDVHYRQYNIAVFGIMAACVFYGIMNQLSGLGVVQVLIPWAYAVFLLPLFLLSRFQHRPLPITFSFSFVVLYYAEWVWNGGGSAGAMQVFFSVVLLAGVYFIRDWRKWLFVGVHILILVVMMVYEYEDGAHIVPYPSPQHRLVDVLLVTVSGALMTVVIVLSAVREVETAKKKNRDLLAIILPDRVIGELISTGGVVPKRHQDVAVLFCDIVDFTSSSMTMNPEILIQRLNDLYTQFDGVVETEGCERIKTMGDAYLAVANMNTVHQDGLAALCRCGLRFLGIVQGLKESHLVDWKIRIGIHAGEVVGAVVGTTKYVYDVFGDTVNFASRLEAYSEPMRINTSEDVKTRLTPRFEFHDRGTLSVKGRGECRMYFLFSGMVESWNESAPRLSP